VSLKEKLNELFGTQDEFNKTEPSVAIEEIGTVRLYLYACKWLLMNAMLVGLIVVFWITYEPPAGGKFIAFLHAAVILGFYKVNEKYFKYLRLIGSKFYKIKEK